MLHKILIVENEPEYYFNFRDILINNGFIVDDFCATYEDAMELIERNNPDLVVLDIDLDSKKTGIDLGNYLFQNTNVPFIFMTALNDRKIFHEALHTHHKSFLVKTDLSTDKEKVVRTILTVLNNHKSKVEQTHKVIGATGMKGYFHNIKNDVEGDDFVYKKFVSFDNIAYFSTERYNFDKLNVFKEIDEKKNIGLKKGYIWFQTDIDDEILIMRSNFNKVMEYLPDNFVQVSQQYIVNVSPKFLKKSRTENHIFVYDQEFKITETFVPIVKEILRKKYLES